ncbi:hypothetical protein BDZ85DRAFT_296215 [Elsinoe ampelina]|uniref:Uncharacterized protein n=1 Tax=Elsinoe ampelina TaxID=302913 RepID=A0A6A6GC81_9PEZI|nr:hypothetical protein BDZ85DRAFT_296215 [Elsinoe ampelina]
MCRRIVKTRTGCHHTKTKIERCSRTRRSGRDCALPFFSGSAGDQVQVQGSCRRCRRRGKESSCKRLGRAMKTAKDAVWPDHATVPSQRGSYARQASLRENAGYDENYRHVSFQMVTRRIYPRGDTGEGSSNDPQHARLLSQTTFIRRPKSPETVSSSESSSPSTSSSSSEDSEEDLGEDSEESSGSDGGGDDEDDGPSTAPGSDGGGGPPRAPDPPSGRTPSFKTMANTSKLSSVGYGPAGRTPLR